MAYQQSSDSSAQKDKLSKLFRPTFLKVGLFFLPFAFFSWLIFHTSSVELPSQTSPLIFYSNQQRQDLKMVFCEALQNAKTSILVHMYGLSDREILSLLKQKAHNGVATRIFYDPSGSPDLQELNGIAFPIHQSGLMHRKILVIDGSQVFLGTANMTPSSLKMHDNLTLGFYAPELARFLTSCPSGYLSFNSGELWLLPEAGKEALTQLLSLLNRAEKSIYVAMFTLTHPELTQALIAAKKRGVDVRVSIDYYTQQGASAEQIDLISKQGILLFVSQGQQLLHHKWAYIDQKSLVIGSANWTEAAFKNNLDCMVHIPALSKDHQKYMNTLWQTLEQEAKKL